VEAFASHHLTDNTFLKLLRSSQLLLCFWFPRRRPPKVGTIPSSSALSQRARALAHCNTANTPHPTNTPHTHTQHPQHTAPYVARGTQRQGRSFVRPTSGSQTPSSFRSLVDRTLEHGRHGAAIARTSVRGRRWRPSECTRAMQKSAFRE
jgi:hypothetical protein